MKKTRETILSHLALVDLVYEMVDARIPVSSRNPDIDDLLQKKPRILLLNKSDLSDPKVNREWVEYYQAQGNRAVLIDTLTKKGFRELYAITNELMQPKFKKEADKGIQNTKTRVMVVGIPNVGKSSIINRIANRSTAKTGNLPGVTKSKQWIKADNNMELLDTPGVLWPKLGDETTAHHLAFTGAITSRILDEETLAFHLLKTGIEQALPGMIERYGDPDGLDTVEYMEKIGSGRGFLLRGGIVDYEKTGKAILDDFRAGLWGRVSLERP